ncbi:MAG: hypothetical protein WC726_04255 [Parcubacteria group bacterium]|jgi:type IV secretory pathway TrbF-like protein
MSITDKLKNSKIAEFWLKYEQKIVLAIGIVLIAAISFEAGLLKGQQNKQEPVIVNKAAAVETANVNACQNISEANSAKTASVLGKSASTEIIATADNQKCAFVASKNSNKYHLLTCRYVQNIKPENKICFSSKEEAESRGFQGAKCCIK